MRRPTAFAVFVAATLAGCLGGDAPPRDDAGGARPLPRELAVLADIEAPPFDGYKRPADVYRRLTECMDAVIRVAPKVGVEVLGLSARRNVPEDTEPGHAYDIARFLVADLAAIAGARNAPRARASLPAPKHIFPTEVYAHAGILLKQLEQLEQRL